MPMDKVSPNSFRFAPFRFAVIVVGIADRARLGNAASGDASEIAPLAQRFARRAEDVMLEVREFATSDRNATEAVIENVNNEAR